MQKTWVQPSTLFVNTANDHKKNGNRIEAHLRQREQAHKQVQHENKVRFILTKLLLQRINNKRPEYEAKDWMEDRRRHLKLLSNISRFPEAYGDSIKLEGRGATKSAYARSRQHGSPVKSAR